MNEDKLAAELTRLALLTVEAIEALANSPNADLEKRIAAILMTVSTSDLPIAGVTLDLIVDLIDMEPSPEFEAKLRTGIENLLKADQPGATGHPLSEPPRRPKSELADVSWMGYMARQAINRACRLGAVPNKEGTVPIKGLNPILQMMTGKDVYWWMDWIREQGQ